MKLICIKMKPFRYHFKYTEATKTIPIMIGNSHERMNLLPRVAQAILDHHLHHPSILPCLLDPEDMKCMTARGDKKRLHFGRSLHHNPYGAPRQTLGTPQWHPML